MTLVKQKVRTDNVTCFVGRDQIQFLNQTE